MLQICLLILIDIYIYTSVWRTTRNFRPVFRHAVRIGIWVMTALAILAVIWYKFSDPFYRALSIRQWMIITVMIIYGSNC